jgi:hypothetical protein
MYRSEAVQEAARRNARRQPGEAEWVVDWSWTEHHRPAQMHIVRQAKPDEQPDDHLDIGQDQAADPLDLSF